MQITKVAITVVLYVMIDLNYIFLYTWGAYFIFFNFSVVADVDSMIINTWKVLFFVYSDNASAGRNSYEERINSIMYNSYEVRI